MSYSSWERALSKETDERYAYLDSMMRRLESLNHALHHYETQIANQSEFVLKEGALLSIGNTEELARLFEELQAERTVVDRSTARALILSILTRSDEMRRCGLLPALDPTFAKLLSLT